MDSRAAALALRAFDVAFVPWRRRRLRAILLAGLPEGLPADVPVLLVANHVSWWDAFLLREVHRALRPRSPILTVMLASELRRLRFFRWLGAVGIDPASTSSVARAVRALRGRLRAAPGSVVLFFPQGRIWPSHRRPLGFRRGVELFARELAPIVVLPASLHLEPLNAAAPTAFVYLGEPIRVDGSSPSSSHLEARVEEGLDRILDYLAEVGEDAVRRWPGPFGRLDARRTREPR